MNYFLCATPRCSSPVWPCFTPEALAVCEERRQELTARRAIALDGLARIGLPVPVPPDGAFYVYFDVTGTGLGAWEFCERALDEFLVALTPGRDFGAEPRRRRTAALLRVVARRAGRGPAQAGCVRRRASGTGRLTVACRRPGRSIVARPTFRRVVPPMGVEPIRRRF